MRNWSNWGKNLKLAQKQFHMQYFFPKFALQFWQINPGFFSPVKASCDVDRRAREEARRISMKLIKVECFVSLWAVDKNKDAPLVGSGGHFLPVYKGLGWRVSGAEYWPMGKKEEFPPATTNQLFCKEQITQKMQCSNTPWNDTIYNPFCPFNVVNETNCLELWW